MDERTRHSTRARVYGAIAAIALVLAVVTLVVPDWIEAVFGVDPDGGDGALEWCIPVVLALVAVTGAVLSRRHLRLSRA